MKRKFESDYMDMLWRMVDFGTIEEEDKDREAGRFFKFNKCCVDNYITITNLGIRGVSKHMADL